LFAPGAVVDSYLPFTAAAGVNYTNDFYFTGGAGSFQANYMATNLQSRGLINCSYGPHLKSFPFYEDASEILSEQRDFMTSFVHSYYSNSTVLSQDNELQAFLSEAVPAQIIDFPAAPMTEKSTLVDILTHLAYLVSIFHPTVNTNSLFTVSAVLPLQPWAFYQPIPTAKGVLNVAEFLPPLEKSLGQITTAASFSRQMFSGTNRTLKYLFDDSDILEGTNEETRIANDKYKNAMEVFSKVVSTRGFDENGLSQGMPFLWKILDPNYSPFGMSI